MTQSRIDADHKPAQTATLRMQLVGANPKPQISGVDALPGKTNYFRGNDPKKWRTNVLTYAKVEYENVYPGIDLVYYGNQRQLEHDFVVAPGADPKTIRLAFTGAEKILIAGQGDLMLKAAGSDVRLREPRVYQDINGRQREIEGRFVLHPVKGQGKPHVGFRVAAYDQAKPLIIDPVLVYSTYLGGGGLDNGGGIAVDTARNAYVTGYTSSADFPTVNPVQGVLAGGQDAFVAKLNAGGSALVYATYLGGSVDDFGFGIAVDSAGNAYVTGDTSSADFPTVNPVQGALVGFRDSFVAKLNAGGSALVYATYLGGSVDDLGRGIAVDGAGNAYVTGVTSSADFPTVNPVQGALVDTQDAFVAKVNAGGSALVYSTYLGGGDSADTGRGIAVDSAGDAYVVGDTNAASFPTVNPVQGALAGPPGVQDTFVTKLSTSGSALVYSTYLGGSADDFGFGIAVNSAGNAYVTGYTFSVDFPTVNPVQGALAGSVDAFVAKLNAGGSALVYATYLGGSVAFGQGIAVDSAGNAYVTGSSFSSGPIPGFPLVNPIPNSWSGGHIGFTAADAFVSKLNPLGSSLVYSTLLGGNRGTGGVGIAVDAAGNAYVTGTTNSESGFPLVNALQPVYGGQGGQVGTDDAFVAKISDTSPPLPQPVLLVSPPSLDFGTVAVGSSKDLEFTVTNTGGGTLSGTASISAPFSIVSGGSFSLAAGASQAVVVRFSPTATGSFTANVSFASNGGEASQVVTGTGVAAPAMSVTPTSLNFGSVPVGSSAGGTFTVQNTGGGTLAGTCNTAVPFSLPNSCSFNLSSGQTAAVTVRFSPTAMGPFTGTVNVTSNGGNILLAIRGTGTRVVTGGKCDRALFRATHPVVCGLLDKLRQPSYFNIPQSAVSDDQLISYISQHRDAIKVLVTQVDYGSDIDLYIHSQTSVLDNEKRFLKALEVSSDDALSLLGRVIDFLDVTNPVSTVASSALSNLIGALTPVIRGIAIYQRAIKIVTYPFALAVMSTYIDDRSRNATKDAAWQDVNDVFGKDIIRFATRSRIPFDKLDEYYELAFMCYRFVGLPDSANIRYAEGVAIARLASQAR